MFGCAAKSGAGLWSHVGVHLSFVLSTPCSGAMSFAVTESPDVTCVEMTPPVKVAKKPSAREKMPALKKRSVLLEKFSEFTEI